MLCTSPNIVTPDVAVYLRADYTKKMEHRIRIRNESVRNSRAGSGWSAQHATDHDRRKREKNKKRRSREGKNCTKEQTTVISHPWGAVSSSTPVCTQRSQGETEEDAVPNTHTWAMPSSSNRPCLSRRFAVIGTWMQCFDR